MFDLLRDGLLEVFVWPLTALLALGGGALIFVWCYPLLMWPLMLAILRALNRFLDWAHRHQGDGAGRYARLAFPLARLVMAVVKWCLAPLANLEDADEKGKDG